MTYFTLQVSNHPSAGSRIPTDEAQASWVTKYDGPIANMVEARKAIDDLSKFYKHARGFKGSRTGPGKMFYAVLR